MTVRIGLFPPRPKPGAERIKKVRSEQSSFSEQMPSPATRAVVRPENAQVIGTVAFAADVRGVLFANIYYHKHGELSRIRSNLFASFSKQKQENFEKTAQKRQVFPVFFLFFGGSPHISEPLFSFDEIAALVLYTLHKKAKLFSASVQVAQTCFRFFPPRVRRPPNAAKTERKRTVRAGRARGHNGKGVAREKAESGRRRSADRL